MSNDRTTSQESERERVRQVADLIRQGWTQGTMARNREGVQVNSQDPSAVAWCLTGAIRHFWLGREYWDLIQTFYYSVDEVDRFDPERVVDRFDKERAVVGWNDAPGRTVDEVLELCRRVEGTPCSDGEERALRLENEWRQAGLSS